MRKRGFLMLTIIEVIESKYADLTKNQKKLADYVKDNLVDVAFMTITDMSQDAGVSTATITRFVKALGYDSFPRFQDALQAIAKKEISPVKEFRFWVKEKPEKDELYDEIEEGKRALDNLYSPETYEVMAKVCEIIQKGRQIFILGSRSTYSMAYFFYHFLKRVKPNVTLVENRNDDLSIVLQYVTKEDVLFAIGYPKYTKFTIQVLEFFKEAGAKTIALTDSMASPLAKRADYVILAKNRLKIYFVTTLTILNTLLVMISRNNPEAHIKLFEEENAVTKELDVYSKE